MFKNISARLVNDAVRRNIVKPEDVEECVFSLMSFFTIALNIISALIIGLILNMVIEVMLFIVIFKTLRMYVGGSHSKTPIRCYVSSCIMYAAVPLAVRYYPFSSLITVCITVISAVIMFVLSPVDALNKPLDEIERKVFRRRARVMICISLIIFLILHYTNIFPSSYYYSIVFTVTMTVIAYYAITGKVALLHS